MNVCVCALKVVVLFALCVVGLTFVFFVFLLLHALHVKHDLSVLFSQLIHFHVSLVLGSQNRVGDASQESRVFFGLELGTRL